MADFYLPQAKNSCDFIVLGSKTDFAAMFFAAAALAIIAGIAIIKAIRKNKK